MILKVGVEIFKLLGRIGIKPKDVIGMGGDIVKMGKSLFNTRVNPKLLEFIAKNDKIPAKILENIKLHARTLKNTTESQKNLFLENIKSIQKAKTPKIPVKSQSPVTSVYKPGSSGKELPEWTKGWTPKVIKGGKDKLADGGRAKFEDGKGVKISPILDFSKTISSPVEGIEVDESDTTYGIEGIYQGDNLYAGGEYIKGKVKVNVQEEGNTVFEDSMSKDDMMKLYVGLGEKEGNHVQFGTDGQGNYTLNIIKSFAKGGIAPLFSKRQGYDNGDLVDKTPFFTQEDYDKVRYEDPKGEYATERWGVDQAPLAEATEDDEIVSYMGEFVEGETEKNLAKAKTLAHEKLHILWEDPEVVATLPPWVQEQLLQAKELWKVYETTGEESDYRAFMEVSSGIPLDWDKPSTGGGDTTGEELYTRFMENKYFPKGESDVGPWGDRVYFDKILKEHWDPYAEKFDTLMRSRKAHGGIANHFRVR